jgi:hypothetical protein
VLSQTTSIENATDTVRTLVKKYWDQEKRYQEELATAERSYAMQLKRAESVNKSLRDDFETLQRDLESQKRSYENKVNQMSVNHSSLLREERRKHREEMTAREEEKTSLKGRLKDVKETSQRKETALRSDIDSLQGALLARTAFTPATDHALKAPFEELVNSLGQLARIRWRKDKKHPDWTDELLGRILPDNSKQIRREVILDSVWMILNKNIFCSPFRVFGEEGQRWEAEWKKAFPEREHHIFHA